jgi:hypothetical protein
LIENMGEIPFVEPCGARFCRPAMGRISRID